MSNHQHDLLTTLIPAIEGIDGGCRHCVSNFVKHANYELYWGGSKHFLRATRVDVTVCEFDEGVMESISRYKCSMTSGEDGDYTTPL